MFKKIFSFLILFVFVLIVAFIPDIKLAADTSASTKQTMGDVDGNKKIEMNDVIVILKHLSNEKTKKHSDWKLNTEKFNRADVNKDNKIDMNNDVITLLKYLAAIKSSKIAKKHPEWLKYLNELNNVIVPEGIKLSQNKLELEQEGMKTLTATVSPKDAENKSITWKSTNEKIATVDQYGNVKAKKEITTKEKTCTIIATTWNGKTDSCNVIVKEKPKTDGNSTENNTTNSSSGSTSQPSVTPGGSGGSSGGGRRWPEVADILLLVQEAEEADTIALLIQVAKILVKEALKMAKMKMEMRL